MPRFHQTDTTYNKTKLQIRLLIQSTHVVYGLWIWQASHSTKKNIKLAANACEHIYKLGFQRSGHSVCTCKSYEDINSAQERLSTVRALVGITLWKKYVTISLRIVCIIYVFMCTLRLCFVFLVETRHKKFILHASIAALHQII